MSDKKSAWVDVLRFVARLAHLRTFDAERLRAIEDRLARLDRGDDATSARRNALLAVNCTLVSEGKEPLNFRIAGDKVEWTGELAKVRL